MQLSRRESLLPHNFFKFEDGSDDHEFKIAFVWARTPQAFQREIQRNGSLEHIHERPDFERVLRNAETATITEPEPSKADNLGKQKRPANSPPRRKFKRQNSKEATPPRNESGKAPAENRAQGGGQNNQHRNSKDSGYQKPHWRNRDHRPQALSQQESGKGKP